MQWWQLPCDPNFKKWLETTHRLLSEWFQNGHEVNLKWSQNVRKVVIDKCWHCETGAIDTAFLSKQTCAALPKGKYQVK